MSFTITMLEVGCVKIAWLITSPIFTWWPCVRNARAFATRCGVFASPSRSGSSPSSISSCRMRGSIFARLGSMGECSAADVCWLEIAAARASSPRPARERNPMQRHPMQEGIHMKALLRWAGNALARYLSRPVPAYHPLATSSFADLDANLRPGDVLLVEGDTRISGAIKYLTQSTWSHAALCLGRGPFYGCCPGENALIEVDLVEGVRLV